MTIDVLFNTMEDVFVTGICRSMAGIGCTCMPGIPRMTNATDCDVKSGRVINIHSVTPAQQMRWWNLVNNGTAAEQTCGLEISTLHLVIACVTLLSIIYCFSVCRSKLFSVLLQRKQ